LLSTLEINGKTTEFKADTTGWIRIPIIPIDFINKTPKCLDKYNTNSNVFIWFDTCFKQDDKKINSDTILNKAIDLEKYNQIELYYGNFKTCDISMTYSLYKDSKVQPILVVNVFVPKARCKVAVDLSKCFLC